MWELYAIGFAVLVGGLCYSSPYRCLAAAARCRQTARTWFYSATSCPRWEGSSTGGSTLSSIEGDDAAPDWLVCYKVFATMDGIDAYVPRDAERVPPRKNLPFFQVVVCLRDGEPPIDVSSSLSMFAYEGNDIGGMDFWRWFLLRFERLDVASVESIRVLDASAFVERDFQLSTVLRL